MDRRSIRQKNYFWFLTVFFVVTFFFVFTFACLRVLFGAFFTGLTTAWFGFGDTEPVLEVWAANVEEVSAATDTSRAARYVENLFIMSV